MLHAKHFLSTTLFLAIFALPSSASRVVEAHRFVSPIALAHEATEPGFVHSRFAQDIDFDAATNTIWAAVNGPRSVWNFDLAGNLQRDVWSARHPSRVNLTGAALGAFGEVHTLNSFPGATQTFSRSGKLRESVEFDFHERPDRIDYHLATNKLVLADINFNNPSASGFYQMTPGDYSTLTHQPFDFIGELAGGSIEGFSVTDDSYWVFKSQHFFAGKVVFEFDRTSLEVRNSYLLPGSPKGEIRYFGLAVDPQTHRIYTQDFTNGSIVGFDVVPEPNSLLVWLGIVGACMAIRTFRARA